MAALAVLVGTAYAELAGLSPVVGLYAYARSRIREAINGAPEPVRWLVFDAEALSHIVASGVAMSTELIPALGRESITFVVARLKGPMIKRLTDTGIPSLVGVDHSYPTVRAAVSSNGDPAADDSEAIRPCWVMPARSGQAHTAGNTTDHSGRDEGPRWRSTPSSSTWASIRESSTPKLTTKRSRSSTPSSA